MKKPKVIIDVNINVTQGEERKINDKERTGQTVPPIAREVEGFAKGGVIKREDTGMNIREAILSAYKKGKVIVRKSWYKDGLDFYVLPTNTSDCCLIIPLKPRNDVGRRWNPEMDDLIALDWEVI